MALIRVTGLFKREKDGKNYLSGKTDVDIPAGASLVVYTNAKFAGPGKPDYTLHMIVDDGVQAPAAPPAPPADEQFF